MSHDHDHDHDDGDHECGKCGQSFDNEEDLNTHMNEEHDMDA